MEYRDITLQKPDWLSIRQALSLALETCRAVRISGAGRFIKDNEQYLPLMQDCEQACGIMRAGSLRLQDDDVFFEPSRPVSGTYALSSGNFSSSVELLLLFLPVLFSLDFRTVLNISGVTHSVLSYTTGFVRESLYYFLEQSGLYASMSLKRFGFYGSGGGLIEARAYPAEQKEAQSLALDGKGTVHGIRILLAGIQPELAKREKQRLGQLLSMPEENISILDIRNASGFGNAIEIFLGFGDKTLVVFKEMAFYNHAGDFIFDEDQFNQSIEELVQEEQHILRNRIMPFSLYRELIPYRGVDAAGDVTPFNDDDMLYIEDSCAIYNALKG